MKLKHAFVVQGRMDHVGVIPEGDEERVSNSQGDTQDVPPDDFDDFSMPPPPMHPMHPASAPYEPQSPHYAPAPTPMQAAVVPQEVVRGAVRAAAGGSSASGEIGSSSGGVGGGVGRRRAPSPAARGARAPRAQPPPAPRGYVSAFQHPMPQTVPPPEGAYYVYEVPSTPPAAQHAAQGVAKRGINPPSNWSGIPQRQAAPPLYHPDPQPQHPHPGSSRGGGVGDPRYLNRGEAPPGATGRARAAGDSRGRAVR